MTLDLVWHTKEDNTLNSSQSNSDNITEQLSLSLESTEVLETVHKINSSKSVILDWNIVWDSCPNCQSEVWLTWFCASCGYSMNDNYNNNFEKHLSKEELLNYINNLEGIFEDIDVTKINYDIIEVWWVSRDRTQFISKGINFEIISLWWSAAYLVEWNQFSLSDIPKKSYIFWAMRARINISTKWKFKQKNILEETWEDASYMKDSNHGSYKDLPKCKGQQYKWKYIHIDWKINESQSELHFMLGWKKYRATIKYDITKDFQDSDSWKVATHINIIKYQVLKWSKWIDEWRLKIEDKEVLTNLAFEILNNYRYNPYITTD